MRHHPLRRERERLQEIELGDDAGEPPPLDDGKGVEVALGEQRLEFAEPQQWFDIPNGIYHATVTPLEPRENLALEADAASDVLNEFFVQLRGDSPLEDIAPP